MLSEIFQPLRGLAAAATVFAVPASAGQPVIEPPQTVLFTAGGPPEGEVYRAGIGIHLADGWHTYWRHPGDAGIAPTLTTEGSQNLKAVQLVFPAPERWSDGYSTSIVYHGDVLLPLMVHAADPSQPVVLDLQLTFGFCREICVPGEATFSATLSPDDGARPSAAERIADALDRVPVAETDGALPAVIAVEPDGPEAVRIRVRTAPGAAAETDLFVEPPDGWYIGQPQPVGVETDVAVFHLSLNGRPKAATVSGTPMRFTVATPDGGIEAVRALP
ncbi:protein-disulfide reductase DsbD domain-containing protein [Mongoliimonas terrestris]|uniref:protein-disulfide reductase DsbD domain-containing protein n=1 Tax=Mongoliimonas terrestris TaxID=1709001 RepID=UPI000AE685B3|nr:protein-disulfide reductase DsbD domain-containing protein [Mongoliimonas terrestris]